MSSRSPRLPIRSLTKLTKSILLTPKPNRLRPPKSLSLPYTYRTYTYTKALTRILHSLNILRIIRSSILNTPFPLSHSLLLFTSITQAPLAPLLLLIIIILNARSLPFTWTFRVLWCVIKVRTRYAGAWVRAWGRYFWRYLTVYMIISTRSTRVRNEKNTIHMGSGESGLSLSLTSSRESGVDREFPKDLHHLRLCEMESWLGSVTPVGAHPFEWEGRYDTWVGELLSLLSLLITLDSRFVLSFFLPFLPFLQLTNTYSSFFFFFFFFFFFHIGPDDSDFNMHMSNSSYPKVRQGTQKSRCSFRS